MNVPNVGEVDLDASLRDLFGHESFRPGQEQIIRHLLGGRDVLAVLPTGHGKSLVFQLASHLLPGMTIVVSPLLALMKDQVEPLADRGLSVGMISSTQSDAECEEQVERAARGETKLLYVTPERLETNGFTPRMRDANVTLMVVDEAHCISQWGHDFRPAYLALGEKAARLGRPTLLALTATATPWVRREIIENLGMRNPAIVVRGSDRPNLFFEAKRVEREQDDRGALERLLLGKSDEQYPDDLRGRLDAAMQGSGIVYTATIRGAEETTAWLREWGIAADYYHGQRAKAERVRVQDAFMAGDLRVIAATNAFGLGVDKQDLRFVIHRDVPPSLESYYQEAGRAGRDGGFARCTLIYRPADLGRAAFLSGTGQVTREDIAAVERVLMVKKSVSEMQLREMTEIGRGKLERLVGLLEEAGVVGLRRGRIRLLVDSPDPAAIDLESEEQRRDYERSRLDMVRAYAEARDCRRGHILSYFGEECSEPRCGMCDNDTRISTAHFIADEPTVERDQSHGFAAGDRVWHGSWGNGVVQRIGDDSIVVLFDEAGYKTLDPAIVVERQLLQSA